MIKITGTTKKGNLTMLWDNQLLNIYPNTPDAYSPCTFSLQPCIEVERKKVEDDKGKVISVNKAIQLIEGGNLTDLAIEIPREEIFVKDAMSWDLIHDYLIKWLESNFKVKAEKA